MISRHVELASTIYIYIYIYMVIRILEDMIALAYQGQFLLRSSPGQLGPRILVRMRTALIQDPSDSVTYSPGRWRLRREHIIYTLSDLYTRQSKQTETQVPCASMSLELQELWNILLRSVSWSHIYFAGPWAARRPKLAKLAFALQK